MTTPTISPSRSTGRWWTPASSSAVQASWTGRRRRDRQERPGEDLRHRRPAPAPRRATRLRKSRSVTMPGGSVRDEDRRDPLVAHHLGGLADRDVRRRPRPAAGPSCQDLAGEVAAGRCATGDCVEARPEALREPDREVTGEPRVGEELRNAAPGSRYATRSSSTTTSSVASRVRSEVYPKISPPRAPGRLPFALEAHRALADDVQVAQRLAARRRERVPAGWKPRRRARAASSKSLAAEPAKGGVERRYTAGSMGSHLASRERPAGLHEKSGLVVVGRLLLPAPDRPERLLEPAPLDARRSPRAPPVRRAAARRMAPELGAEPEPEQEPVRLVTAACDPPSPSARRGERAVEPVEGAPAGSARLERIAARQEDDRRDPLPLEVDAWRIRQPEQEVPGRLNASACREPGTAGRAGARGARQSAASSGARSSSPPTRRKSKKGAASCGRRPSMHPRLRGTHPDSVPCQRRGHLIRRAGREPRRLEVGRRPARRGAWNQSARPAPSSA